MAKIIAVTNQKGGIGKTTTALALAEGLKLKGYKVLFIDMDPQCNSTDTYQAQTANVGTLYDLLLHGDPDVIQHTELGDIIAGDKLLKDADKQIVGPSANFRLRKGLETIAPKYDYIIMDTGPALSVLLINALTAADSCVIPLTADRYGLQGLTDLQANIRDVKEYTNPRLEVDGLLLIKFSGRLNTEKAVMDSIDGYARMFGSQIYVAKIRQTNAVQQAQLARQGLFTYAPDCTAAEDYREFVEEFVGEGKAHG